MVRVKICGITNAADARCAVSEGADALGFVFAKSPRRVDAGTAAKIVKAVGPFVATIGVFVDEPLERMLRIGDRCGLSGIQLHGNESAATVRQLQKHGFQVIKALRAGSEYELKKINDLSADAVLFDTVYAGKSGGTGRVFDWIFLKNKKFRAPWIVSGGLNPSNVARLLSTLDPYGVDVSSGVEKAPGKKSEKLVKEFIHNAKSAR